MSESRDQPGLDGFRQPVSNIADEIQKGGLQKPLDAGRVRTVLRQLSFHQMGLLTHELGLDEIRRQAEIYGSVPSSQQIKDPDQRSVAREVLREYVYSGLKHARRYPGDNVDTKQLYKLEKALNDGEV